MGIFNKAFIYFLPIARLTVCTITCVPCTHHPVHYAWPINTRGNKNGSSIWKYNIVSALSWCVSVFCTACIIQLYFLINHVCLRLFIYTCFYIIIYVCNISIVNNVIVSLIVLLDRFCVYFLSFYIVEIDG